MNTPLSALTRSFRWQTRRKVAFLFLLAFLTGWLGIYALHAGEPGWKTALPGWVYEFPRDHWAHPGFKTEWWYFTGRLETAEGREFGFEITFFRQGVRPPGSEPGKSRFAVDAFSFAHYALTDVAGKRFLFEQNASRGAFGEAGVNAWDPGRRAGRIAWQEGAALHLDEAGAFQVSVPLDAFALNLRFTPRKPPVINGKNGVSQKAEGAGRASHYYSMTRLAAEGTVTLEGETFKVAGEAWCDREWATNQLASHQLGWNWLSLQWDDGSELMLYQMRTRDGGTDPHSSGTAIAPDGTARHLEVGDYQMTPLDHWKSPRTGGNYPVHWKMSVPSEGLEFEITTPLRDQELTIQPISYWEGLVHARGTRRGKPVRGHGYLEMTGYTGPLKGLTDHPEGAVRH